jgi:hypothetical protein
MAINEKNAYVLLKGGIYHPVENYQVAFETTQNDYLPGDTFRNDWSLPAAIGTLAATATGTNFYYPPEVEFTPGVTPTYSGKPTAYLPDPVAGVAPRDLMVKQTRLRFFELITTALTAHVAAGIVVHASNPFVDGDLVALSGSGTAHYVINAGPGGFGLAATEGGALLSGFSSGGGTLPTLLGWSRIADFKPQEWKSWSNIKPVYAA